MTITTYPHSPHPPPRTHKKCPTKFTRLKYTSTHSTHPNLSIKNINSPTSTQNISSSIPSHFHLPIKNVYPPLLIQNIPLPTPTYPWKMSTDPKYFHLPTTQNIPPPTPAHLYKLFIHPHTTKIHFHTSPPIIKNLHPLPPCQNIPSLTPTRQTILSSL